MTRGICSDHIKELERRKRNSESKKGNKNPFFGKKHTEEELKKMSESHKGKTSKLLGKHLTSEHCKNISNAIKGEKNPMFGKQHSVETRKKQSEIAKKRSPISETTRKKISKATKNRVQSEATRKKRSLSLQGDKHPMFGKHHTPQTRKKMSDTRNGEKTIEERIGGFWYGNVKYGKRKRYCELWNRDLWERIDAYQNYKSILSDKTKTDNNNRALSRHHVYWQEKACCVWDEDSQGYYAIINIGTAKKPTLYKYYVGEDPNKFVLLTRSEHGMVAKDKLKWIKIFEDLIKKQGNKCYYTKEEFAAIKGVL